MDADGDDDRTKPLGDAPKFDCSAVYFVSSFSYDPVMQELGVLIALGHADRRVIWVEKRGWLKGAIVTIRDSRVAQAFEDWVYLMRLKVWRKEQETT